MATESVMLYFCFCPPLNMIRIRGSNNDKLETHVLEQNGVFHKLVLYKSFGMLQAV